MASRRKGNRKVSRRRKMPSSATFTTGRYQIIFERIDGLTTFPDPPNKPSRGRSISLAADLGTRRGLEAVVHEALHAEDNHATEAKVERAARNIARFLWRLGFRCESSTKP